MARPRKNSLSDVKAPSKKPDIEVVCMKCGETKKANRDFYMSYNSKVNIAPFCKKCVVENSLDENGNVSKEKFINVLQQLDRPFLNQIYNKNFISYGEDSARFVGFYMKDISLKDYRELTFADSDMGHVEEEYKIEEEIKKEDKTNKLVKGKTIRLDKATRDELSDKWGFFEDTTLNRFEKKFNQISKNYEIITSLHLEGLVNYCKYSTLSDIAIESGNIQEAKMYGDLAKTARSDAKLNPNQLSAKDMQVGGVNSFSEISQLVAQRDGIIRIPRQFLRKPQDIVDLVIWENVNFNRALLNMPEIEYEELHGAFIQRLEDFNKRYKADIENGDLGTWGDN